MNSNALIKLGTLLLALTLAYQFFWNTDERQIQRQLDSIEELTEFEEDLSTLAIGSRVGELKDFFTEDFKATAISGQRIVDTKSLDKIKAAALYGAKLMSSHNAKRTLEQISVDDGYAKVEFSLISKGKDKSNTDYRELLQFNIDMLKVEGRWLIKNITADRLTPED